MIHSVAIGFGGNVGGRTAIVERFSLAREAFAALGPVRAAPLFRTTAIGPVQDPYFNTAIVVTADFLPRELIATTLEIEALLGRDRSGEARWGPRVIDLDVLVVVDPIGFVSTEIEIEIPHPRAHERRFVLEPLAALLGEDFVVGDRRIGDLLRGARAQGVEHWSDTW